MKSWLLKTYFLLLLIFSVFSFVLSDPNLILFKADAFVAFQTFMWQTFLPMQNFRTIFYGVLILLLFTNYLLIIKNWSKFKLDKRKNFWKYLLILALPLVISYNALSHDVFNYIFNAKMVVEFGANPHIKTATDFAYDPMLRFMNNVHTPAPYGYGWTALSLLPYVAGLGKFTLTFYVFKLFALLSLLLTLLISEKFFAKDNYKKLALFFLNPLVLIEVLSSAHNDLWMLAPALLAVYLADNFDKQKILKFFLIIILLAISISIKFVTIILLPLIIYLLMRDKLGKLGRIPFVYDLAALAMFTPLFIERSKQFLPWYLIWPMIFLPLLESKYWRNLLIVFAISSMLRYLPWFYLLPWMSFHLDTSHLETYQKWVTWAIPALWLLLSTPIVLLNKRREK